jgi:glycerophosphoryl diester phosphodiesterase
MGQPAAPSRPEVVGHRGAADHAPGNTERSFRCALEIGVDRVECDVQRSVDGALVLVHDETLVAADGRRRAIATLTLAELRSLLPGLLLLDDLVEIVGGRTPLMVDVKRPGYEGELIAAFRRHGLAETASVPSTWLPTLRRLRHAFPTLRLGLSTGHLAGGAPLGIRPTATAALRRALPRAIVPALMAAGADELMVYHRVASPALVTAVQRSGRRINLWTVDRDDDIGHAIALRPDGIISNRPEAVVAALAGPVASRSPP